MFSRSEAECGSFQFALCLVASWSVLHADEDNHGRASACQRSLQTSLKDQAAKFDQAICGGSSTISRFRTSKKMDNRDILFGLDTCSWRQFGVGRGVEVELSTPICKWGVEKITAQKRKSCLQIAVKKASKAPSAIQNQPQFFSLSQIRSAEGSTHLALAIRDSICKLRSR